MATTIYDLINKHLSPYRRSGRDEIRSEICPFCKGGDSEDRYTFSVNTDTGSFYCFRGSCSAKGGVDQLAAHFGESMPRNTFKLNSKTAIQYKLPTTELHPLTQPVIDYFKNRCIGEDTLNAYKVSTDKHGNIVFPFILDSDPIFVKHRMPRAPQKNEPKEWADPDTRPILFGMNLCSFDQPLVITEGMIDTLSLYEIGIRNVVSVPSGCENLRWIEECWDWLERFNDIVIFGDNDAPGRQMVNQLVKRLGESRCRIVEEYPAVDGKELKDANDILCKLGELSLLDAFDSAKDIPVRGLIDLSSVIPEDPTTIERIQTRIPALDDAIGGLRMGAITVFTGKPGNGKSTLAGTLLLNAIESGYNCCAYSGEMNGPEFQNWINLQAAGSDYITLKHDPVKNKQVPCVPKDVAAAITSWYRGKLFLYDNNEIFDSNQADAILDVFTTAVRKHDCKLFLIDSLMCATSDTDEETRAQGKFVNAIKRFANKYQVHIILIAHGRKLAPGKTTLGQDDIAGNSATIRLAHSAVVVEKPNLRVIKSRDSGQLKLIECCYCPDSHRIYQKDKGDLNKFSWNDGSVPMPKIKACDSFEYSVQVGEPDMGNRPF